MEKWVEPRFKVYDPKKRCGWKRQKGARLELGVVMEALRRMGLLEQFEYGPNAPVDWIWKAENWEFECKRLGVDKNGNEYTEGKKWLWRNVVARFSDKAERKVLVTARKFWNEEGEEYLRQNGVDVIITGRIDNRRELEAGIERFITQFLELVEKAAEEEQRVMA